MIRVFMGRTRVSLAPSYELKELVTFDDAGCKWPSESDLEKSILSFADTTDGQVFDNKS